MAVVLAWPHLAHRRRPRTRRLGKQGLLLLLTFGLACGNGYEPGQAVVGVFEPTMIAKDGSHCITFEGRRDGWISLSKVDATICDPVRINELGTDGGMEVARVD